jgi:5-methylcytosine-specific restriction protein A
MPFAPPKPCRECGRVRCARHPVREGWAGARRRPDATPRVRGAELQRRRAALFRREPWCRACAKSGQKTRATIRDHIVSLSEGGRDDETNVQPLCEACSDRKTAQERLRGRQRGRDDDSA